MDGKEKKLKQKVACKMVLFSALCDSRTRNDLGQPVSHYNNTPDGDLIINMATNEPFERIINRSVSLESVAQLSVRELKSNFEVYETDEPYSNMEQIRNDLRTPQVDIKPLMAKNRKPVPTPRPVVAPRPNITSPDRNNNRKNAPSKFPFPECHHKSSSRDDIAVATDNNNCENPLYSKPKPKPKPKSLKSNTPKNPELEKSDNNKTDSSLSNRESSYTIQPEISPKAYCKDTPKTPKRTLEKSCTVEESQQWKPTVKKTFSDVGLNSSTPAGFDMPITEYSNTLQNSTIRPKNNALLSETELLNKNTESEYSSPSTDHIYEPVDKYLKNRPAQEVLPEYAVMHSACETPPQCSSWRSSEHHDSEESDGWDSDEFDDTSDDEDHVENIDTCDGEYQNGPFDTVNKKIYNIAWEMLTTERAYVKRLYLLDKVFQERILGEARETGCVAEKTVEVIFSNLSSIHSFHRDHLLPDLENRLKKWKANPKIGDIFKSIGPYFQLYKVFVKNFDNSLETLKTCTRKSPKFAELIVEIQKQPECERLTLQHHMLEPIQRVPRYKLLLQDYLKRLPEGSEDMEEAKVSLEIVSKAADGANESMKEDTNFKSLLAIQERVVDGLKGETLVTPGRIFIKEGELIKLSARSANNKNIRTVLLFNDFLLCCTSTTMGKLRVRQIMDVCGLAISSDSELALPECAFRIRSRQRVLDLIAKSEEEKAAWHKAVETAAGEITKNRGSAMERNLLEDTTTAGEIVGVSAPVWVKDEDVSMCMLCALKFGLIHRKHHCRGCGRVICDKCSNYRAKLEYKQDSDSGQQRVCYACYKKIGSRKVSEVEEDEDSESEMNKRLNSSFRDAKTRDLSDITDMSGLLFWKAPGKGWSKEWVVLIDFVLYIQKRKQDIKAHFTLPVPGLQIDQSPSSDETDSTHPHCIKLHKENKKELTYYLACNDKELMKSWQEHLNYASQLQKFTDNSQNI